MVPPPRGGGTTWIGARPTAGVTALLVVEVAAFLVYAFLNAPGWVAAHLALIPRRALGPEPWQLVTSGVVHLHFAKLLSTGFGIWIFGTAVEQMTSTTRVFALFGAAQLGGTLVMAALGRVLVPDGVFDGCEPGVLGLVAAFGVFYNTIPLRFFGLVEMRGRTMAWLVLGLTFFTGLLNHDYVPLAGGAVGVLVGWIFPSSLRGDFVRSLGRSLDKVHLWRLRRRYKVISGGRDSKRYLN